MIKESKNKQTLLIVGALLSLVLIIAGISYAIFNYIGIGSTENVIKTSGITFLYTENSTGGIGIQISNALPISDSIGEEDSNYFDFKITSKSMNNIAIPYDITVKKIESSNVEGIDDIVRLYLTKVDKDNNSNEEVVVEKTFGSLKPYKTGIADEKLIYKARVPGNNEKYEQNYRLRMWIAEEADFSPDQDGNYPYNGVTFKVQVNVYAEGAELSPDDIIDQGKAKITSLTVNGTAPDVSATDDKLFEMTLPTGTKSVTIDVETSTEYQDVKIEQVANFDGIAMIDDEPRIERMSASKVLSLSDGHNYFKITVTSENGETPVVYKLHISLIESVRIFGKVYELATDTPDITNKYDGVGKLYKSTETNSGQPTYYFRGNVTDNWVSFAGYKWRIIRINEDSSIRIIMQNGINNTKYTFTNSESKYYYSQGTEVNNAKYEAEKFYDENIKPSYSNNVVVGDYCEQAKVISDLPASYSSTIENVEMKLLNEYTPDFKCEVDGNGHGLLQSTYVGLITYDEVVMAGGTYNSGHGDSNFYLKNSSNFFTMSSAGKGCYGSCWSWTWIVNQNGSIDLGYSYGQPKNLYTVRPVINLDKNVTITKGEGTESNPFLITGSPEI